MLSCKHAVQSKVKRAAAGQNRECMGWLAQRSREMARDIWLVLRVRSFQLIVLQVDPSPALQPALSQAECIALGQVNCRLWWAEL